MKDETQIIRKKFIKADYPIPFVNSVIKQYNNNNKNNNNNKEQKIDNDIIIDNGILYHLICLKTKNRSFY